MLNLMWIQPKPLRVTINLKLFNDGKGRTAGTNVTTADLHPLMTLVYDFSKPTVIVHLLALMAIMVVPDPTVVVSFDIHMLIDFFSTNIIHRMNILHVYNKTNLDVLLEIRLTKPINLPNRLTKCFKE